jgi:protein-tyrosine phosphatase
VKEPEPSSQPSFDWLTEGLAVGGCFPVEHAADLARRHGIGAVVDLREEDRDDEEHLRQAGLAFLHLPAPDMEALGVDGLDRGVAFVRDRLGRGDKVLIHCQHGIGRSPLLALCVLVEAGWAPLDALEHAKAKRRVLSLSRAQYDGWVAWLTRHGHPVPSYHEFGCIAYRHHAGG